MLENGQKAHEAGAHPDQGFMGIEHQEANAEGGGGQNAAKRHILGQKVSGKEDHGDQKAHAPVDHEGDEPAA